MKRCVWKKNSEHRKAGMEKQTTVHPCLPRKTVKSKPWMDLASLWPRHLLPEEYLQLYSLSRLLICSSKYFDMQREREYNWLKMGLATVNEYLAILFYMISLANVWVSLRVWPFQVRGAENRQWLNLDVAFLKQSEQQQSSSSISHLY